jgi:hypothetical protein
MEYRLFTYFLKVRNLTSSMTDTKNT